METYICGICKNEKPITDYYFEYSKRGHTQYCKICLNGRKKQYYKDNPDKAAERKRKNKENNLRHALLQREYVKRYKKKVLKAGSLAYYKKQEERILAARLHRMNNPEQEYAHGVVKNALKFGKIKRPYFCENCGKETKTQAHHEDYLKPLEINWLCRSCHMLHHRGVLEKGKIL
jgi:hypothetical protein